MKPESHTQRREEVSNLRFSGHTGAVSWLISNVVSKKSSPNSVVTSISKAFVVETGRVGSGWVVVKGGWLVILSIL